MLDKKQKGAIGEQQVVLDLLKKGFKVLLPINEDCPYDLVVDNGDGTFTKVQCKYREDTRVPSHRTHSDRNGVHNKYYTEDEIDIFAMVLGLDDPCVYYVPFDLAGIFLKGFANNSWSYLREDFIEYPCKDNYYRKLMLSNGKIVSEEDKSNILESYNPSKDMRENSKDSGIPYGTYRKWVLDSKNE